MDTPSPATRRPHFAPPALPAAAPAEEVRRLEDALRRKEREAEAAQRDAQALRLLYQELFLASRDGFVVTDGQGIILEANPAAAALLQSAPAFLPGKPLPLFVAPGARAAFYALLSRLGRVAPPEGWEVPLLPPRGQLRLVSLTAAPLPAGDGQAPTFRWLFRDLTVHRQAEQALRQEKNLSDSIVDTVEAAVLVLDGEGRVVRCSPYLGTLSGYRPEELHGLAWCDLFIPEPERPAAREMLVQVLATGAARGGILGFGTKDGRRRAVAWSAKLLANTEAGSRLVLLGYDATDLQEAQGRALQAERLAALGQVVAGLAHEGRNALQRIQASITLLGFRLHGRPEVLEILAAAQKAQDDLRRLFDDVRGYAAPVRLEPSLCDLGEVWREAWADLRAAGRAAGAALRERTGGTDLRCVASPFHLKQVFTNLLDNALSAGGPDAPVVLRCAEAELGGRPGVRVAVCDAGPGFTAEARQKGFDAFFTTKVRGTGLGLSISKRIVEAHGGRLEIGGAGPGGEVHLTLPRRMS